MHATWHISNVHDLPGAVLDEESLSLEPIENEGGERTVEDRDISHEPYVPKICARKYKYMFVFLVTMKYEKSAMESYVYSALITRWTEYSRCQYLVVVDLTKISFKFIETILNMIEREFSHSHRVVMKTLIKRN